MIYENIIRFCKERGIAVARLEKECGLGNATVRNWKTSSPSIANVQKVAEFFGCTVDDLLKGQ